MGRRKIEIEKLTDNNSRQVTFSKRRFGLFKKANELATLCAADVAIIAFSPGGKPFSFGSPSVESVAWRFLHHGSPQVVEPGQEARVNKLNQKLNELHKKLEAEKKRGEMLRKMEAKRGMTKWDTPIDELNLSELEELKESLDELRVKVKKMAIEKEASSSLMLLGKNPVQGGN